MDLQVKFGLPHCRAHPFPPWLLPIATEQGTGMLSRKSDTSVVQLSSYQSSAWVWHPVIGSLGFKEIFWLQEGLNKNG